MLAVATAVSAFMATAGLGCQSSEAPRVELPVSVDGSGLEAPTSDLGWRVELEEARVVIADIEFTTAGEVSEERAPSAGAWLLGRLEGALWSTAWAHPGHEQGGEVIGELPGTWAVDFVGDSGLELGLATLLVGNYTAINFTLGSASSDEVDADDELLGHSAILRGVASLDDDPEASVAFTVVIDSPEDRQIVGAPFDADVDESSPEGIALRLLDRDPIEDDHLFDGIDFAALDALDGAEDGVLVLVDPDAAEAAVDEALSEAYYQIRREFQSHDLFEGAAL
ncbi:hypothetical protein G6O69_32605 [Pseudenhygromyxa sp. WMMC2535]|uniref:hypothetical protein n=1 Tax=Pseudenhygromyxa sp. WMMC2535 TaxID=2712867 RepID=UPI00155826B8|nr:hypothetical protein [Pseudenhygromyxa sp. WMMC2535]NVB42610.1 hypothetical protein [Pseudenhygromyxa sp. WMMC2535]